MRTLGLVLVLGTLPAILTAQLTERVRWPLVDVLVRADTSGAFELIAAPNLRSKQGVESKLLDRFGPPALDALQWATLMRRAIDSLDQLPGIPPLAAIGPRLNRLGDSASVYLGLSGKRRPRFRLVVDNTPRSPAWQVEASVEQLRQLLDAVVSVAGLAVRANGAPRPMLRANEKPCPLYSYDDVDDADDFVDGAEVVPPALLYSGDLKFPRLARPQEGRVWLQFVVDSTGSIDQETACIVLTDGDAFSQALQDALPTLLYRAGRLHGVPVRTLAWQEFRFTYRRP